MPNDRRQQILDWLTRYKSASLDELGAALHYSRSTIRRDVLELEEMGLMQRGRGRVGTARHLQQGAGTTCCARREGGGKAAASPPWPPTSSPTAWPCSSTRAPPCGRFAPSSAPSST